MAQSNESHPTTSTRSNNQIARPSSQRKFRDSLNSNNDRGGHRQIMVQSDALHPMQMVNHVTTQSMMLMAASSNNIARPGCQRKLRDSRNNDRSKRGGGHRRIFPNVNDYDQIDSLIQVVLDHPDISRPRNMAAVWYRLQHLLIERKYVQNQCLVQQHQLNSLFESAKGVLETCGPTKVSQIALSMAKISQAVRQKCGNGQKRNHRNAFHNLLVKDKPTKHHLFQSIAAAAGRNLRKFDPQAYSNLTYACAIAEVVPNFNGVALFDCIADAIIEKDLTAFKPHQLSITAWSYATAKVVHIPLFKKVAEVIVSNQHCLRTWQPQDLSNIVWSYSTAKVSHPSLFQRVADEIIARRDMGLFEPHHIANVVWSFSTAKVSHRGLFARVADEVIARKMMRHFKLKELSSILWGFATAKVRCHRLFEKISSDLDLSESFDPRVLTNIACAYATAKVPDQTRLFARIAEAAILRMDEFSEHDIVSLLWAFSSSGVQSRLLFQSVAPRVADVLNQCSSQNLATISWTYAVANVNSPILFDSAFVDALLENLEAFDSTGLRQLYEWHLWMKEEERHTLGLPHTVEKLCYEAFVSNKLHRSIYHKGVVSALGSLGLDPKDDVSPKGVHLEACVKVGMQVVNVRVDGPQYFVGRMPTGRTILRRRLTVLGGVHLLSIPYWEWNELGDDFYKQQNYLRDQLGMM